MIYFYSEAEMEKIADRNPEVKCVRFAHASAIVLCSWRKKPPCGLIGRSLFSASVYGQAIVNGLLRRYLTGSNVFYIGK